MGCTKLAILNIICEITGPIVSLIGLHRCLATGKSVVLVKQNPQSDTPVSLLIRFIVHIQSKLL